MGLLWQVPDTSHWEEKKEQVQCSCLTSHGVMCSCTYTEVPGYWAHGEPSKVTGQGWLLHPSHLSLFCPAQGQAGGCSPCRRGNGADLLQPRSRPPWCRCALSPLLCCGGLLGGVCSCHKHKHKPAVGRELATSWGCSVWNKLGILRGQCLIHLYLLPNH